MFQLIILDFPARIKGQIKNWQVKDRWKQKTAASLADKMTNDQSLSLNVSSKKFMKIIGKVLLAKIS